MSQDNNQVAIKPRSEFGKNASRRARRDGLIPAVVYAKGKENRSVYLDAGEWDAIARHRHHIVYLLEDGKKQAALVREVQFNHMKNFFVHIDFQMVDAKETIHTEISLRAIGDSVGVARGGVLEQLIHELPVECKPTDLVDVIEVDVAELAIGDSVLVKELKVPGGVKVTAEADAVVFHVSRPRLEEESTEATEATEPEAIKEKKRENA